MEKTKSLVQIDRSICNYFQAYNITKKNQISGYPTKKQQIAGFYKSMGDSIFQKMKENQNQKNIQSKRTKAKTQILTNIQNPTQASLPEQIFQNNTIKVDRAELEIIIKPAMFSEVQTSKKSKYTIAKEVIEMIAEDIRAMVLDKQQANFRKKFPNLEKQTKNAEINSSKTEELIKQYNRILTKFKNNSGDSYQITLGLLEQNILQDTTYDVNTNDQKFQILGLFKKIYLQTKSQNINENLIKYIKKFQLFDKLGKKTRAASVLTKKTIDSRPMTASSSSFKQRNVSKIFEKTALNFTGPKQSLNSIENENKRSLSHFCRFKQKKGLQIKKSKLKIVSKNQNVKNH